MPAPAAAPASAAAQAMADAGAPWRRTLGPIVLLLLLAAAAAVPIDQTPAIVWLGRQTGLSRLTYRIWDEILTNKSFYIPVALILLVERFVPATRPQRLFSVAFFQDFGYFILDLFSEMFIMIYWVWAMRWVYDHAFWYLTVEAVRQWPPWAAIVVGFVGVDFLYWFNHLVRHKVTWMWHFHAIHHSQRQMNLFTDHRYHVLEYLIAHTIVFIPLFALGLSAPTVFKIAILQKWYTRFYHANIRTNLGPLRYVLVTPQSHRVHHSALPEHRDRNFGVVLSIWDQILGTQYRGWNEYPPTGLQDDDFPCEYGYVGYAGMLWRQFVYPFRMIWKSVRRTPSPSGIPCEKVD
ncbi:MAG: sterol desaturase family protein [Phycisphaeraceae bacterium]